MNSQRGFVPVIIGIVVLVAIVAGAVIYQSVKKPVTTTPPERQLVGNDRDEYGCIGSAGYSWCEAKQKCLRVWEKKCDVVATSAINTTGWKTYKSEVFGFEMQIPTIAIIKLEDNNSAEKLVYIEYDKDKYFEVRLRDNKQWNSLNDYFKITDQISLRSATKLANREALILYRPAYGEGGENFPKSIIVATDYNGYFYIVTFFGINKLSATEEKIISTFKFTK